jgi:hypothetical protein
VGERACGIIVRMNNERSEHSRVWMKARRLRAWELLQQDWKQIEASEALGGSAGRAGGRPWPGRKGPKPAAAQASGMTAQTEERPTGPTPGVAAAGACAFGFSGEIWTRTRIAQVIRQEFGVFYHPTRVGNSTNAASAGKSQPCAPGRRWAGPR